MKFPCWCFSRGLALGLGGLFLGAAAGFAQVAEPAGPADQPLFGAGMGVYFTYRIPAAVGTRGGNVVLFCEGRKGSASDFTATDLLALRSADGGRTWSQPQVVWSEGSLRDKITIGNPCPVYDADTGRLWCSFTRENQQVYVTASDDDGRTWSRPREITPQVRPFNWTRYWTGPGHGVQLQHGPKRGRLVMPSYHLELESADGGDTTSTQSRSHVVYSDDHGKTWQVGGSTELGPHIDRKGSQFSGAWVPGDATWQGSECMAAEVPDGGLYLIVRNEADRADHFDKKKAVTWSRDAGQTWAPLKFSPQLPDLGCESSLVSLAPSGLGAEAFLAVGPTRDAVAAGGVARHGRQRLAAYVSSDGCQNWREVGVIQPGFAAYSDLVALPAGDILCFYDGAAIDGVPNRMIRMARLSRDWLVRSPAPAP